MNPLMTMRHLLLFCSIILIGNGCSKSNRPADLPKLYPAAVTIRQEDKELSGAAVRLVPLDVSNTWTTGAVTDSHGKATLRTHGRYPGAPAGKYKVCVTKTMTDDEPLKNGSKRSYHVIGPEYDNPANTPFELEITSGKNAFEFNVPKTVKIVIPFGGAR